MLGNRTLCLDSAEKANFAHIQTIGCSVVVIDSSSLTEDLDLSSFSGRGIKKFQVQILGQSLRTLKGIEKAYILHQTVCENPKLYRPTPFKIILPSSTVKSKIDEEFTVAKMEKVRGFQEIANKSKVLSYNFTSGSTGPPKIQIFKNQLPVSFKQPSSEGLSELMGKERFRNKI